MFANLHSKSSQQQAQARAAQKAADIETASISTFATDLNKTGSTSNTKPMNGTVFSEEELKEQNLRSQIRIGI